MDDDLALPGWPDFAEYPIVVIVVARSVDELARVVGTIESTPFVGIEAIELVIESGPADAFDVAAARRALASSGELRPWRDGHHGGPPPVPAPGYAVEPTPPMVAAPDGPGVPGAAPIATRGTLDLVDGRVLYTAPERMRTGDIEQVEVRVARGDIVDAVLRQGLRGRNPERIETIPTSTSMTVEVTTSSPDGLRVVPLSPPTQLVHEHLLATWEFDLHAQRRGRHLVRLSVRCEVEIDGEPLVYSPPVIERHVEVDVAPGHAFSRWWREHWKWAVATVITVSGASAGWWALLG